MYVYEVIPGAYEFISIISFFKTYSNGYFRIQQNETGYFFGMTLVILKHSLEGYGQMVIFYLPICPIKIREGFKQKIWNFPLILSSRPFYNCS